MKFGTFLKSGTHIGFTIRLRIRFRPKFPKFPALSHLVRTFAPNVAGAPSTNERFLQAWQWAAETIYEGAGLDKTALYSNALWDNVARASFGGYVFSYGFFKKAYLATDGAEHAKTRGDSQWKTRMLWAAIVSPSVLTSCLLCELWSKKKTV